MTFSSDLQRFADKVERRNRALFVNSALEVQRSVVEGSEITSAPGQPVDTGTLKGSWQSEFTALWAWQMTTNLVYAPIIENGGASGFSDPGAGLDFLVLRSQVGGFHSVKLTRGGWQRIVDHVTRRVARD